MKRCFDLFLASFAIFALFPVLIVVFFMVYFVLGWPVFFSQVRPGLYGKPFKIYKFRTMLESDVATVLSVHTDDAQRMTKFGRLLRSSSLDELPQLWNVIRGDMSLVGPRPLLMEYLPLYNSRQVLRHNMRPGITGWAQVNGRNNLSWQDKFELDVWYVENQTFLLDIKILWRTFIKVFKREGISSREHVTSTPFEGNDK